MKLEYETLWFDSVQFFDLFSIQFNFFIVPGIIQHRSKAVGDDVL